MDKIVSQLLLIICMPVLLLLYTLAIGLALPVNLLLYCCAIAFLVHWVIAIPSLIAKTEFYFDLTGSLATLSMLAFLLLNANLSYRAILLLVLCAVWTIRLGGFLFYRIHKYKVDKRFNALKQSYLSFAITWQLSAVWTFLTILAAITAIVSPLQKPLALLDYVFVIFWFVSFCIETFADMQKLKFKKHSGDLPFITTGLWRYSRHPNYFGEISLWFFVSFLALPNLFSWLYLSLISPIFVWLLLTKISGVNLLEAANDKKYGHLYEYKEYKKNTPILCPKIWF